MAFGGNLVVRRDRCNTMTETQRLCAECGESHSIELSEIFFARPDAIVTALKDPNSEVVERGDTCFLNGDRFFIRGVLPLPVSGRERPYRIGAWVELDAACFDRVLDLWDEECQSDEPAFPCVLANSLPNQKETVGLVAKLKLTGITTRPDILITDETHSLYAEQRNGISIHRATEYTELPK